MALLPLGTFRGRALGCDWIVTRHLVAGGRGEKLVAHALQGSGYISLNLYHLDAGALLKPCEMAADTVLAFLDDLQITQPQIDERPPI